jgi:cytochrome P450
MNDAPDYPFEPFDGRLSPRLADAAATQPVMRVRLRGRPVWLVTGYDEVRHVLTDRRLTRAIGSQLGAIGPGGTPWRHRSLGMDGPPHAALRRLAARAFTARRVQAMLPAIQAQTDELFAELLRHGPPADLVSRLAFPLPMNIICRLLGVPSADRARFAAWSDVLMTTTGHTTDQIATTNDELTTYLRQRVQRARHGPGEDLLTSWTTARDGGDELAEEEVLHLAIAVLVAGHETTANAIGNALWFLIEHSQEANRLRSEPDTLPAAIEELLRLQQPSDVFRLQIAMAPVEIGGIRIRPGDAVMALPFVANRDSRAFNRPHCFTPGRGGDHLAFGTGPHYCLGAALARAELHIVLHTVLTRMPGLRMAVPRDAVGRKQEVMVGGLAELPVTWDPPRT